MTPHETTVLSVHDLTVAMRLGKQAIHDIDRVILDHFTQTGNDTCDLFGRVPSLLFSQTPDGHEWSIRTHFSYILDAINW